MMRQRWGVLAGLVAGVMALTLMMSAQAQVGRGGRTFVATLTGYQEVPAISTIGSGSFTASLTDATTLVFTLTYANLEGDAILFTHIHFGQFAVNGGVAAFLCGGGGKPACPPAPATITGTIVPADVIGPAGQGIAPGEFAELVRAMTGGFTYVNLHTTTYPGGEIRGQIQAQ